MTQQKKNQQASLGYMRFFVEQHDLPPNFTPCLVMTDLFKKVKPQNSVGRIFSDHNLRYFTLNLRNISLVYSEKQNFSQSGSNHLPMEELQNVYDIPLEPIGPPSRSFSNFALTLQFRGRTIVLVAKTEQIFRRWLNHLEMLRQRDSGKSVLIRRRTEYMIQEQSQIPEILFENGLIQYQTNNQSISQTIQERTQSLDGKRQLTKLILEDSRQRNGSAKRRPSFGEGKDTPKALTMPVNRHQPEMPIPRSNRQNDSTKFITKQKAEIQENSFDIKVDQITKDQIKHKILQQTIPSNINQNPKPVKPVRGSPLKPQIFEKSESSALPKLSTTNKGLGSLNQAERLPSLINRKNDSIQSIKIEDDDIQGSEKQINNHRPYMFIQPIRLESGGRNRRSKTTENKESQRIESSGRLGSISRNIWQILDDDGNLIIKPEKHKLNFAASIVKRNPEPQSQKKSQSLLIEDDFNENEFMERMLDSIQNQQNFSTKQNTSQRKELPASDLLPTKGFFLNQLSKNQQSQDFKVYESDAEAIKFNIYQTPLNESQRQITTIQFDQMNQQNQFYDSCEEIFL